MLAKFRIWLADRIIANALQHPYYHLLRAGSQELYMRRYWLVKPRPWLPFYIRLHCIHRSDEEGALHDHPRPNISILLKGTYIEIVPADQAQDASMDEQPGGLVAVLRRPWRPIFRAARHRHRLVLNSGTVWSLFIMGPRTRATKEEAREIARSYNRAWAAGRSPAPMKRYPKYRSWGFWPAHGWTFWREHADDWATQTSSDEDLTT